MLKRVVEFPRRGTYARGGYRKGDAGQLAGTVGSRTNLVSGGRSELPSDSQPALSLCFRNCSVSSFHASSALWGFIYSKSERLYSCLRSSHCKYIVQQVFEISYVDSIERICDQQDRDGVIQWLVWPSSRL